MSVDHISQAWVYGIKREQDYNDKLWSIPFAIKNHQQFIRYLQEWGELGLSHAGEIEECQRHIEKLRQELKELKAAGK